jgi:4'-phosphopantetheinyl transferase
MNATAQWSSASKTSRLTDDAVHVWRASLAIESEVLRQLKNTLSNDERARAQRFIFERDQNRFIAARGILRDLLGRYLRCAPSAIEFVYGPHGKPAIFSAAPRHPLRFNLSHSHELALIAISREREIGIDVEMIRSDFASEEIARRYFSLGESDELRRLPAELRTEGFFLCWTRKEAYIKALGNGLHIPLDSFDVSLTPGLPAELRRVGHSGWSLRSFLPYPGYVAAVVGEGTTWQLSHWDWAPPSVYPS